MAAYLLVIKFAARHWFTRQTMPRRSRVGCSRSPEADALRTSGDRFLESVIVLKQLPIQLHAYLLSTEFDLHSFPYARGLYAATDVRLLMLLLGQRREICDDTLDDLSVCTKDEGLAHVLAALVAVHDGNRVRADTDTFDLEANVFRQRKRLAPV